MLVVGTATLRLPEEVIPIEIEDALPRPVVETVPIRALVKGVVPTRRER